jgi:hypothetical protein
MGVILDDITCFKDAITGGSFEALTVQSGQSLALRWLGADTRVWLLDAWGGNNTSKCDFSIRSPLLHDNTRGMRFSHMFNPTLSGADGNPQLYLPPYWRQPYEPTDTLVVEVSGTAAADVTFTQSIMYDSPTVQGARLLSHGEVEARLKNIVGIRISPSAAGATSDYGTAEAINSDDDRLKANTDYALLGITTDLPFTTLQFFGPDTANFPIPIPGHWDTSIAAGWFYEMSRRWQAPFIPVINSNNKGVTFTRLADAGGGTSPLITLQFAELA